MIYCSSVPGCNIVPCYRWGHLAPTCPDTIGCFPYYEQDPFVLDTLPDVFIVGNQVPVLGQTLLFLST